MEGDESLVLDSDYGRDHDGNPVIDEEAFLESAAFPWLDDVEPSEWGDEPEDQVCWGE